MPGQEEQAHVLDLKRDKHLTNQVAAAIYGRVNMLHENRALPTAQMLAMNAELHSLTDHTGFRERI